MPSMMRDGGVMVGYLIFARKCYADGDEDDEGKGKRRGEVVFIHDGRCGHSFVFGFPLSSMLMVNSQCSFFMR